MSAYSSRSSSVLPCAGPLEMRQRRGVGLGGSDAVAQGRRDERPLLGHTDRAEAVEHHSFMRSVGEKRSPGISSQRFGEAGDQPGNRGPKGLGDGALVDLPGAPVPGDARIPAVAGQQLVAAFAGQHHRDMPSGERRHEVQRDARRMRDRLVLVPDEPRQGVEEIGFADDHFVPRRADRVRDRSRVLQLAVRLRLEGDRKCLEPPPRQTSPSSRQWRCCRDRRRGRRRAGRRSSTGAGPIQSAGP